MRKAVGDCQLPYGHLHRRVSGNLNVHVNSRNGPEPVFTKEEEEAFANWLSEMAK